jgi:hypothetical protein
VAGATRLLPVNTVAHSNHALTFIHHHLVSHPRPRDQSRSPRLDQSLPDSRWVIALESRISVHPFAGWIWSQCSILCVLSKVQGLSIAISLQVIMAQSHLRQRAPAFADTLMNKVNNNVSVSQSRLQIVIFKRLCSAKGGTQMER